jgi:histidinol-phosphate/aromatic aminotransferase/cobyric acid decarboxylase-like protein
LVRELEQRGVRVFPSAANFLLADFGESGPAFFKKLARHNILVRERSHDLGPGYARITIGTQAELQKLLEILGPGR